MEKSFIRTVLIINYYNRVSCCFFAMCYELVQEVLTPTYSVITCKKSCCPILKLMKRKGACSYDVRQIFGLFKPLPFPVIYAWNIRKLRTFLYPFPPQCGRHKCMPLTDPVWGLPFMMSALRGEGGTFKSRHSKQP